MKRARGFTLVELVVTIAISAIVLAFAAMFIQAPADAYIASAHQAELQDSTSIAWPRMQTDIQLALPNSARQRINGNIKVLELLPIVDSARFMSTPGGSFKTAGVFKTSPTGYYLAVDNEPASGRDAYNPASKVMTTAGNAISPSASDPVAWEDTFDLTPVFVFNPAALTTRHIYLVQKPVTYLCDQAAQTLQRFTGYDVAALQSARDTAAELLAAHGTGTLLARNVTFCAFNVDPPPLGGDASQIVSVQMNATRDGATTSLYETAAVRPLQ
jgi:prepilin-type N-terminal cleavage/methylation domain-containing protein